MLTLNELKQNYRHGLWLLYWIVYLAGFFAVEHIVTVPKYIVQVPLDHMIPFSEIWVIPYGIWFFYIIVSQAVLLFTSREEFLRQCVFLFGGMSFCLILYLIFPNGQPLRPEVMPRSNVFTEMVAALYQTDTPTNVCPSIHWLDSIGIHIAVMRSKFLKPYRWVQWGSLILCVSICLSTLFIKQHSIVDGIAAIVLSMVLYFIAYRWVPICSDEQYRTRRQTVENAL